jgi:hypothetical protein
VNQVKPTGALVVRARGHVLRDLKVSVKAPHTCIVDAENDIILRLRIIDIRLVCHR